MENQTINAKLTPTEGINQTVDARIPCPSSVDAPNRPLIENRVARELDERI